MSQRLVGLQRNQTTLLVWQQRCSRFFNKASSKVCEPRDVCILYSHFQEQLGLFSLFPPLNQSEDAIWSAGRMPKAQPVAPMSFTGAESFLTGSWVSPWLLPALFWLLKLPSRYIGPAGRFLVLFPLFTLHSLKGFLPKLREQGYSGIVCLVTRPSISFHKMLDKREKVFDIIPSFCIFEMTSQFVLGKMNRAFPIKAQFLPVSR
jgi:hypothetical protein